MPNYDVSFTSGSLLLGMVAALFSAGCDYPSQVSDLEAAITVTPEAQETFAANLPMQVLVTVLPRAPGQSSAMLIGDRVGVICSAGDQPFSTTWKGLHLGCSPARIVAWLSPLEENAAADPACGPAPLAHQFGTGGALLEEAPRGSAPIFEGADPEDCEDAVAPVSIVVTAE